MGIKIMTEESIIEYLNRLAEVTTSYTSNVQCDILLLNIIDLWQEVLQTVS